MRDGRSSRSSRSPRLPPAPPGSHISRRRCSREIGRVAFEKWRRSIDGPWLLPQTCQRPGWWKRNGTLQLSDRQSDVASLKTRVRKEGKKGQLEKCFQPVGMRPHQSASSAGKEGGASVRAELRKEHETVVSSWMWATAGEPRCLSQKRTLWQ